jgi:hypothetical protein
MLRTLGQRAAAVAGGGDRGGLHGNSILEAAPGVIGLWGDSRVLLQEETLPACCPWEGPAPAGAGTVLPDG